MCEFRLHAATLADGNARARTSRMRAHGSVQSSLREPSCVQHMRSRRRRFWAQGGLERAPLFVPALCCDAATARGVSDSVGGGAAGRRVCMTASMPRAVCMQTSTMVPTNHRRELAGALQTDALQAVRDYCAGKWDHLAPLQKYCLHPHNVTGLPVGAAFNEAVFRMLTNGKGTVRSPPPRAPRVNSCLNSAIMHGVA